MVGIDVPFYLKFLSKMMAHFFKGADFDRLPLIVPASTVRSIASKVQLSQPHTSGMTLCWPFNPH